ncbi:hypothetical protein LENED_005957 [Lentinula edodes]|uniref:Uncharacterized protein n=1 Tax=Lentinula edodes TaxID=5353 RepID=A0A1Q3EAE9_LENED|nr:hypothetical protein LENED_005957 [Lentinula edodes]
MPSLSDVWLLVDDTQMTSAFSGGSWITAGPGNGPWLGNTSTYIGTPGGDIIVSFQGTSISFTGNTPSATNSPTWFLAGIDSNTPYNVSFPDVGTQIYTQWYQTPMLPDGLHVVNLSSIVVDLDYVVITAGSTTPLSGSTIVVDDRSPEIAYTGSGWTTSDAELNFGGSYINGPPLGNTTHRTNNVGDGFVFPFAGNNIDVYGIFEWTATGSIGIDFTLDGETTPSVLFVPTGASVSQPEAAHYQLFSSGNLRTGNHSLIMNITQVDGNQSFVLDYLTYQPSFSSLSSKPNFTASALSRSESCSTSLPSPSNTGVDVAVNHSMKTRAIIGGVVGGVLGVVLIVALFFLLRRRRNRQAYHERVEKSILQPSITMHREFAPVRPSYFTEPATTTISEPESSNPSEDVTNAQIEELKRRLDSLANGELAAPPAYH